jgi:hypothetical protein
MIEELISNLKITVEELRESGFTDEACELELKISTAYTTPSELLGEVGLSIKSILNTTNQKIPSETKTNLVACSKVVGKTWPKLRC